MQSFDCFISLFFSGPSSNSRDVDRVLFGSDSEHDTPVHSPTSSRSSQTMHQQKSSNSHQQIPFDPIPPSEKLSTYDTQPPPAPRSVIQVPAPQRTIPSHAAPISSRPLTTMECTDMRSVAFMAPLSGPSTAITGRATGQPQTAKRYVPRGQMVGSSRMSFEVRSGAIPLGRPRPGVRGVVAPYSGGGGARIRPVPYSGGGATVGSHGGGLRGEEFRRSEVADLTMRTTPPPDSPLPVRATSRKPFSGTLFRNHSGVCSCKSQNLRIQNYYFELDNNCTWNGDSQLGIVREKNKRIKALLNIFEISLDMCVSSSRAPILA